MHRRKRTDKNQDVIVSAFRVAGASVLVTNQITGGLDLLIGVAGTDQRVEVKNMDGFGDKLTPAEQKTFDEWQGRPPVIIKTPEEATALVFRMKMEAHECKTS